MQLCVKLCDAAFPVDHVEVHDCRKWGKKVVFLLNKVRVFGAPAAWLVLCCPLPWKAIRRPSSRSSPRLMHWLPAPQVDILSSDEEVQEVVDFVAQNAKRLLGVEIAQVCQAALAMEIHVSAYPFCARLESVCIAGVTSENSSCQDHATAAIMQVLPVAARKALAAKISIGGTLPGGDATPARTSAWQASRNVPCSLDFAP